MARKKVREYNGKLLLKTHLKRLSNIDLPFNCVQVERGGPGLATLATETVHGWLNNTRLVVKPDMLFGKRGKNNLVKLNCDVAGADAFIADLVGREISVGGIRGVVTHFLVEPFVPHKEEYYFCIQTKREGELVSFSPCGGMEIEEHWDQVRSLLVSAGTAVDEIDWSPLFDSEIPATRVQKLKELFIGLFRVYVDLDMTLLEMNPMTFDASESPFPLDLRMELDNYAGFRNARKWGDVEFPEPWGREKTEEEQFIEAIDDKSGASLKLTILNPSGHIWPLVAGGGSSVCYADTVCDVGYALELGCYNEYSGNPTTEEAWQLARTVIRLATQHPDGRRRALLLGGGVANFSDVAAGFSGICQAIKESAGRMLESKMKVFVRRGGPNYKAGLRFVAETCRDLMIPVSIHGPEDSMTCIVAEAIDWIEGRSA